MSAPVHVAASPADYAAFAGLVADYVAWCRVRHADDAWLIEQVFGHQSLDRELAALPVTYGPPNGVALLAMREERALGGGAYRRLDNHACEMKRLFVREGVGHGIGRALCDALILSARNAGYRWMRLDTGHRMKEAIALYRSLGFVRCAPYHAYPAALMPHLIFMELPLDASQ